MLHTTLQHALTAMHAGRLDEAADLLNQPSVRPHRRGQQALTRLVEQLMTRAADHCTAGEDRAAEADADRVLTLVPDHPEALTLRRKLRTTRQDGLQRGARELAHARRLAALGDSLAARSALGCVDGPDQRRLKDDLEACRVERQVLLERGEAALASADWPVAARTLERLAANPDTAKTRNLRHRVHAAALDAVAAHLRSGSIGAARRLANLGLSTDPDHPTLAALGELDGATESLARHDTASALASVRRAAARLPDAAWVPETLKHLTALRDAQDLLAGGPLGDHGGAQPTDTSPPTPPTRPLGWPSALSDTFQARRMSFPPLPAPPPLILHRDSEPLAVIASASVVELAPAAHAHGSTPAAHEPDRNVLSLFSGHTTPALVLARDEEGHLLSAGPGLTINDRAAEHTLLSDGDRLGLGPRLRLIYRRPNPASQSAVLEVAAGRLLRPDLRKVVLLASELLIGPHRGCHLRDAAQNQPLVIRPGDGTLLLDGHAVEPGAPSQTIGASSWSVTLLPPMS